eukprot:maker-scaffold802_size95064-snap-gene-0.17 protein:Tk01706 transcript:maker-scaffold802_size95064-snap-gene-0.17-mRNA-1 annotation:"tho complex subunit 4"
MSAYVDLTLEELISKKKIPTRSSFRKQGGGKVRKSFQSLHQSRRSPTATWPMGTWGPIASRRPPTLPNLGMSNKILLSNLAPTVTQSDVIELFSEFGILTSASLHHDHDGKTLGTAEIVFQAPGQAQAAIKKYHGVPLDNRTMNIQFAINDTSNAGAQPPWSARLGLREDQMVPPACNGFRGRPWNNSPQFRPPNGQNFKPKGGKKKFKRGPNQLGQNSSLPSAEELDAEMDAYMAEAE